MGDFFLGKVGGLGELNWKEGGVLPNALFAACLVYYLTGSKLTNKARMVQSVCQDRCQTESWPFPCIIL